MNLKRTYIFQEFKIYAKGTYKGALGNVPFDKNFLMSITVKCNKRFLKVRNFSLWLFHKVLWRETPEIEKLKIDEGKLI